MEKLVTFLESAQRLEVDSRRVLPGDTFLAYPGEVQDGRTFIGQAIAKGAASIIWEQLGYEWPKTWQVQNVGVMNLKQHLGQIASIFYKNPSHELYCIGITGTNGKTSCCHWIAQALTATGKRCALIGTLGNGFPDQLLPTQNTTPDTLLLHGLLKEYLVHDAWSVAMEVSSHGLVQGRVNGVEFDVALFTNLTRDHLDFHGSMDAYRDAKSRLFSWPGLKTAVINSDDIYAGQMMEAAKNSRIVTYGFAGREDLHGEILEMGLQGTSLKMDSPWGKAEIKTELIGRFNASNLLGVAGVLLACDVPFELVVRQLMLLQPVSGRFQKIGGEGMPKVIVDYAHTPDALEKVLATLRETLVQGGRLICVFGCGGDRDAGKRPLMGQVAERWADLVILTEDNSRFESALDIIKDIQRGMKGKCWVEIDRSQAIHLALKNANALDVVLVAGKGHEIVIEKNGERFPFNDLEKAHEALIEWTHGQDDGR
ncbi:MAG: UDP-N-acetylmuramoyl-L-alanyl-D-glutamate--2,6-diaminopimelate ligase [Proteobacteria bacterium]|nr:UDP-N-acetylmuramoyl-L-alanyl-D-glutamate--2,6-diaminopimelate ligase [Pseudomonadota bacterium]MDE3208508.1 UDP-N-acetylmuramoyl-L-alanyl-D-glutamate--2,6-diaminopimelate ligase [Pseudomonadota bacterium]